MRASTAAAFFKHFDRHANGKGSSRAPPRTTVRVAATDSPLTSTSRSASPSWASRIATAKGDLAGGLRGIPLATTWTSATRRRRTVARPPWRFGTQDRESRGHRGEPPGRRATSRRSASRRSRTPRSSAMPISASVFVNNAIYRMTGRPDGAHHAPRTQISSATPEGRGAFPGPTPLKVLPRR